MMIVPGLTKYETVKNAATAITGNDRNPSSITHSPPMGGPVLQAPPRETHQPSEVRNSQAFAEYTIRRRATPDRDRGYPPTRCPNSITARPSGS
ncbi:hypothetical protein GCM10017083_21070 [Thalassobaculum fulvum]|uniref:Uncharacterized protein n=1 Tax=Thalassobaculum fulvum TaxID=1633335 RepID=A0A918XR62_9PROT|nr:hypothetical protein GCM10017083_21070 [Thalassobaculum fulvum]